MPLNAPAVKAKSANVLRATWNLAATAESVATVALIAGWSLLTWGIASLTVWQVWPISGGLFLLGCFGFRLLVKVFGDGFYALHATSRDRR